MDSDCTTTKTKICAKCGKEYPDTQQYWRMSGDKTSQPCHSCVLKYRKDYYQKQLQDRNGRQEWEMYYISPESKARVDAHQARVDAVKGMAAERGLKLDCDNGTPELNAEQIDMQLGIRSSPNRNKYLIRLLEDFCWPKSCTSCGVGAVWSGK